MPGCAARYKISGECLSVCPILCPGVPVYPARSVSVVCPRRYPRRMALFGWDWAAIGAWIVQFGGIVLAPIFGLLGTIVGARIGVRDAQRRWTVERRDARRDTARAAALELAEASFAWSSAQIVYGGSKVGIRGPDTPPDAELSDTLGAAVLRQRIAYAALYTSVGEGPIRDAALALEEAQKPYQQFISDDDAGGVLDGEAGAMERSRKRLILGGVAYRGAMDAYISTIAPALVPEQEG